MSIFSLRISIPSALLVFALLSIGWTYRATRLEIENHTEAAVAQKLNNLMNRLQSSLENGIRQGDSARVVEEVSSLGADLYIRDAVLVDADNIIVSSIRLADIGKDAREVLSSRWADDPSLQSFLRSSKPFETFAGITHDNENMICISPISFGTGQFSLRPDKRGALLVRYDLGRRIEVATASAARQALVSGGFLLLLTALLAFYLDFAVVRPLRRLSASSEAAAEGDFTASVPSRGNNELANLGKAFNRMLVQRAAAEASLQDSERRYRAIVEDQTELICRFLGDGTLTFVNEAYCHYFDRCWEDLVGQKLMPMILEEDRVGVQEHFASLGPENQVNTLEHRVIAPNGEIRWQSWTNRAILDDDGEVLEIQGTGRDITERKQAEARLRLMQFSIDHNSNTTYRVKFDGSICYVNKAASQSLGYTPDELLSMSVWDIDPDFPKEAWPAHWREMTEAGSMTFEAHHKTKDGRVFPVEIQSNFLSYDGEEYIWAHVRDLSERKAAEKEVRASEERFRKAFDYSPIGMAICSPSGAFLDVNDMFCEIIGYSAVEMLARDFQSITHPDDLQGSDEMRNQLLSGAVQRIHTEMRYVHREGRTIWARLSVATVSDDEGSPQILLAQIEDVSARVVADQRLHAAEARSREVLENVAEAIIAIGRKGVVESFNPAALEMFGYAQEEVIGQNISMLMPEPDRSKHDSYLARYMDTREKRIIGMKREAIARKKNGQLFPVELSISEVWTGDEPTFTAIVRDVAERQRTEDRMREHAALVEIAPSAILLLNLDNTVKFCNRATEEIYGWSGEEISGRRWDELAFEPESHEYDDLKAGALGEGSWNGELKQIHRSGKELALDAHAVLLRDDEDRPRSILLVCNDITQKKALELQHLHSQRLESLGTLAAGIAHDLNNILTPILMAITPLRASLKDERALEILDTVLNCAERGSKIVKQVLTFAKESEGTRERLSPGTALLETKSIISDTFPKSIRIRWEIDEEVSSVFADPTHLQQVLLNLCVNARDAMPGGGDLHVHVENVAIDENMATEYFDAEPGAYVVFHVRDSGEGIPPKVLERAFDPFFTTKGPGAGTGLGLATVSTIVRSLGGFIDVQTEIGEGTHFKIYIPALDAAVEDEVRDVAETPKFGTGQVVLVVDDETGITNLVRRILETSGYKVLTAGDGVEGKALFEKHQDEIDLLLTDMMMPGMDGAALIRAIRSLNSDLKVIAVSGLNDHMSANSEVEANEVIMKPFNADALLCVVGRVLSEA